MNLIIKINIGYLIEFSLIKEIFKFKILIFILHIIK